MSFLISQLKRSANKHRETLNTDVIITDVNRLLEEKSQEDYQMLKAMKMSASTDHKISKHGKLITINQKMKDYGEVFHIDEIKDIACKYALKFLHSSRYRGAIDHSMFQKIRQFGNDKKLPIDEVTLNYKMYILAPPSAFKLSDKPKDPLLFYKLDENHYVFVCKWGNDFTFMRRLIGVHRINLFTLIFFRFLPAFLFLGLYLIIQKGEFIPFIIIFGLFGVINTIVTSIDYDIDKTDILWAGCWNNEFKIHFW